MITPPDPARDLAELSDELNAAIAAAGDVFASMNLGVSASVEIAPGRVLTFGKRGGTWHLYTQYGPILHASREARMLAVEHFDALYEKLIEVATTDLAAVKDAADKGWDFVRRRGR